jgi:outer membrane protein
MMEVNADYNNYLQAKQKIVNAQKAIEQATENLRVERNKLASSSSTATEFLTANNQLIQAQINKTTAMANAELAYRKLLKSTNQNKFQ